MVLEPFCQGAGSPAENGWVLEPFCQGEGSPAENGWVLEPFCQGAGSPAENGWVLEPFCQGAGSPAHAAGTRISGCSARLPLVSSLQPLRPHLLVGVLLEQALVLARVLVHAGGRGGGRSVVLHVAEVLQALPVH